ncbi:hypothetical protein [Fibrobacter sp.]|uniref:hypothetical protein n=1 Tax=Fibrobacter sp. TaxID=35828 RepID=UPI0025C4F2DA|nr:hypothetical protein [Fibrobacter sp.]MBR3072942.1 hypothetical protein [Fibrobacter sp.]
MFHKNFILAFLAFASIACAQTMKEGLFNMVSNCYNAWEKAKAEGWASDDAELKDFGYGHITYDIPNGYVETSGITDADPPFMNECEAKAAAFKDAKGKYTYVKYDLYYCRYYEESTASRDIKDVMPEGFGLDSFVGHHVEKPSTVSFLLTFDIPKIGTEMDIHLKILPFGLAPNDVNGLTYKQTRKVSEFEEPLLRFREIADHVDNATLLLAAEGKYDKIPPKQKQIFDNTIKEFGYGKVSTKDILLIANDLKKMYDIYSSLECVQMTLKWNKQTARFEIKSKGPKPPAYSTFKDFLDDDTGKAFVEFVGFRC